MFFKNSKNKAKSQALGKKYTYVIIKASKKL